jgi:hypothetical protein
LKLEEQENFTHTHTTDLQLRLEADEGPEFGVDAGCPPNTAEDDVARLLVKPISEAFGIPKQCTEI